MWRTVNDGHSTSEGAIPHNIGLASKQFPGVTTKMRVTGARYCGGPAL
jgi:hypothetical protein